MRVYVAAKFEDKERVRALYAKLRAAGHEITHDWTFETEEGMSGERLEHYLRDCAEDDLEGVSTADIFLMYPHEQGKGEYVELGAALVFGKPIVTIGPQTSCIFFKIGDVYGVDTDEQAIVFMKRWETCAA